MGQSLWRWRGGGRIGDLKSCGCERDGVGGREVRDDSQGVGGMEAPFPDMGSLWREAGWEEDGSCVEGCGELLGLGWDRSEGHGI